MNHGLLVYNPETVLTENYFDAGNIEMRANTAYGNVSVSSQHKNKVEVSTNEAYGVNVSIDRIQEEESDIGSYVNEEMGPNSTQQEEQLLEYDYITDWMCNSSCTI